MTKETAIIKAIKENGVFRTPYKQDEVSRVVSKAIKALEQEPKAGHWIEMPKEDITECMAGSGYVFVCSECKKWENHPKSFCPNCGAKMIEPQESEGKE